MKKLSLLVITLLLACSQAQGVTLKEFYLDQYAAIVDAVKTWPLDHPKMKMMYYEQVGERVDRSLTEAERQLIITTLNIKIESFKTLTNLEITETDSRVSSFLLHKQGCYIRHYLRGGGYVEYCNKEDEIKENQEFYYVDDQGERLKLE